MKKLNIAIIGQNFMGKAHSHAWANAGKFFDLAAEPILKVACARDEHSLRDFADTWGWEEVATDWREVVERDDIDVVDISVPTKLHREIAVAAAEAGKHLFCEKPVALDLAGAREMLQAAEDAGVVHYLNHNYRRVPAIQLAKQLIDEGRIGRIYHWRGAYLQDWIADPSFPLTWHLQKDQAGSGPHHDLNSHSVDLARFLVGEITNVAAMTQTFVAERPLPGEGAATFSAGSGESSEMGEVTVEDAAFMVAEFESGALGSFDVSRFARGRRNSNCFEIYGSKGSLSFNLERMNELEVYAVDDPDHMQGFRTVMATEPGHPYMHGWWPPGHIIGYEHSFHHAVVDFVAAVAEGGVVRPNLEDGVRGMAVLEAGLESASTGRRMEVERA